MKWIVTLWAALIGVAVMGQSTVRQVPNVARLIQSAGSASSPLVETAGYYSPGDGGGAVYRWASGYTGTTNAYGGALAVSGGAWVQIVSDEITIRQFGATGNGVTDDTLAIRAAVEWAATPSNETVKRIVVPTGNYIVSGPIVLDATSNITSRSFVFTGHGQQNSVITQTDLASPTLVLVGYRGTVADLRVSYQTLSDNPNANGIMLAQRNGQPSSWWNVSRVTIKNSGTGICKPGNPVGAFAGTLSAGATNVTITSGFSDSIGPLFYRECEISIPLLSGGSHLAIIQQATNSIITFDPPMPSDSTAGGNIEQDLTSHNNVWNSILIDTCGFGLIHSRARSSGDTWASIYANSRISGTEDSYELKSGVGVLLSGHADENMTGLINVEWITVSRAAVALLGYRTSVESLHIEGVKLSTNNAAFVEVRDEVDIKSLHIQNHTILGTNTTPTSIFKTRRASLTVNSLSLFNATLVENWSNSGRFFLVNDTDPTPSQVRIVSAGIAPSSGLRERFLVTPTDRHIALRQLGNIIQPGVIAFRRNMRIDSASDQALHVFNKGIPRRIVFGNASDSLGSVMMSLATGTGGTNTFLPYGTWAKGTTNREQRVVVDLAKAPFVAAPMYLRSTNWLSGTAAIPGTSVSRRRIKDRSTFEFNLLEVTMSTDHGLAVGDLVFIDSSGETSINGYNYEIVGVPSSTVFRIYSQGPEYGVTADVGMNIRRVKTMDVYVYGDAWANMFDYATLGSAYTTNGYGNIVPVARSYQSTLSADSAVLSDSDHVSLIDPSAVFEARSTSKGALVPRMTSAQRAAISAPAEGLIVYDTDRERLTAYDGSQWATLGQPKTSVLTAIAGTLTIPTVGRSVHSHAWEADGSVDLVFSPPADGDTGTLLIRAAATNVTLTLTDVFAYSPSGSTLTVTGGTNNWSVVAWEARTINSTNVVLVNLGDYSR